MGACMSTHVEPPNFFQRNLCIHHKNENVTDVYKILHEIGKGAFGVVEEVEHLKTKKHFAMKTVTFGSGNKRSEFEKEMDILRGLHHPNIVRMIETFEDANHFYIIMELCAHGTMLEAVKTQGKEFSEEFAKDIVGKLASVIQYLHSRFICHRDLKLENILTTSTPTADGCDIKLCDFGASTLFRSGVSMRKVLGSVVYMAPEVLEGNYSQACDLWSLGVIMYMLLSNKAPFHGVDEDELIQNIFDAKINFDDPVWKNVSLEAKALIKKLLNPDAATRYTAAQVLSHPWIKSHDHHESADIYDEYVPRLRTFCNFSPFRRAALVAVAFCMPSSKIRKHSEVYNELNVAHNGLLTLQELQQAPALKRFNLDFEYIFQALDQNDEKGVNLLEFVAATIAFSDIANDQILRAAFSIFDRQHIGTITAEDLHALLGHNFDIKKCEEMIKRTDADNDGKVGFEDFSKMLKSTRPLRLRRRSFRSNSPCKNQHRDKNNNNQNPMNPITTMPTTVEQKKRRLSLNLDEDSSFKHLNLEIIEARASKINIQLNPLPSITTDPKTMENVQQILSLNNNHSNHNHNHNNNNNVDPTSCSSTSQRSSVRRSKSFCGSMRNNKEIAEIELEIEMEAAAEPESQNTAALPEISMV